MYTVIDINENLGSSLHVRKIAEKLTRQRHDFKLLAPRFEGKKQAHPFEVIYLGPTGKIKLLVKLLQDLAAVLTLFKLILTGWKPDVIYSRFGLSTIFLPVISKLTGIPYVTEVNGAHKADLKMKATSNWLMPVFLGIERLNYLCSDRIVSVSDGLTALIQKMRWVKKDKVVTVLNGVEVDNYKLNGQCTPEFKQRMRASAELVFGFVGRFEKWHGLANVVDALAQIQMEQPEIAQKLKLLLIGIGTEQPALETQVAQTKTGNLVKFIGWVPNDDLPKYLACVDIALAPYMPFAEDEGSLYPCPLKILEYLAAEKWIIAVDTTFSELIRENKAGYILSEINPTRLKEAIYWAWNHRDQIFKEMHHTRIVVEQSYNWDVTARKVASIMQGCIK